MYDTTEIAGIGEAGGGLSQDAADTPLTLPLSLSGTPPLLLAGIDEEEWGEPHVVRGID
ncbi:MULTISPECIES: hypothetical protein [unclassified Streptomyces]|uniref:hypothetical protein n=1 Tax=unclassified Streptomyces TaxID=2593676 RepID=UPI00344B1AE5